MKIVLAPDSFKECLSAMDVADALGLGLQRALPQASLVKVPMADGGEGTVAALVAARQGLRVERGVTGPHGQPVLARYGWLQDDALAVIELASASGLERVAPEHRNPLHATSRGTGELILDALDRGARRLLIGLGGSATNDGGAGLLQALGARLLDAMGHELPPGGAALRQLVTLDVQGLDPRLAGCDIRVACDVTNPLCGPEGASAVFGPQKGATPAMVATLDLALHRWGEVLHAYLGHDIAQTPGTGAAGGAGVALLGVLKARLQPGIELVMEALHLQDHLAGADLVITGEGRTDHQSAYGKTPVGVARLARQHGVPVVCVSGAVLPGAEAVYGEGVDVLLGSLRRVCSLPEALADARDNLEQMGHSIGTLWRLGAQSRATHALSAGND